jgi:hypothetical protein
MTEFEDINKYLFDRYDKLAVDENNHNSKQDKTDNKFDIINLLQSLSNTNCNLLNELLSNYTMDISYYNISKKEYYENFIYEYIKKIYNEYKTNIFSPSNYFINQILKEINKENNIQLDEKNVIENKIENNIQLNDKNIIIKNKIRKKNIKNLKINKKNNIISKNNIIRKKKKYISAVVKRLVWNNNIGEELGKAKCMCCKVTDITQMSFNCGHIIAESKGGETTVSNLKPICQNCNSSMGTKNMYEFMKTLI